MRLVLHPPGLIRLFSKQDDKASKKIEKGEAKRPENIDPDSYEVTPYGRRPLRKGRQGLKLTAKIVAVGAAAAAVVVWILV
jgi:hypothetical protein